MEVLSSTMVYDYWYKADKNKILPMTLTQWLNIYKLHKSSNQLNWNQNSIPLKQLAKFN